VSDPEKLAHVKAELDALEAVQQSRLKHVDDVCAIEAELGKVNQTLWRIEDDLRGCERESDFGPQFVELARSVYLNNDRRSELKQRIDQIAGSAFQEVKSYR